MNVDFYTYTNRKYVESVGWDGRLVNKLYAVISNLQTFQSTTKVGLLEGHIVLNSSCHTTITNLLQYTNSDQITILLLGKHSTSPL